MANKSLDFVFNLIDRVSAPGKRISKTFETIDRVVRTGGTQMNTTLRRLATTMGLPTKAATMLATSMTAVGHASRAFDVARSRASQLWSGLGHLRTLAFGLPTLIAGGTAGMLGKTAINAAAAKEQSLIAFEMLTGTSEGAQAMWDDIMRFDAQTPFQFEDVVENWQTLLTAGFSDFEIPIILSAVGDLASLKGMDREVVSQLTDVFSRINTRGKMTTMEFDSLTRAGVKSSSILEHLASAYGITSDAARELISSGAVDPQTAIWAALESIKHDYSGGTLGGSMSRFSSSLTGLWADLIGRPNDILRDAFEGFDDEGNAIELAGFSSLRRFLHNLTEATDQTTEVGERTAARIRGLFSDVFEGIFEPLAAATAPAQIQRSIDQLFDRIETGMDWIRTNVPPALAVLKEFFTGMRTGIGFIIAGVTWAIERIRTFTDWVRNLFGATDESVTSFVKFAGIAAGVGVALKLLNMFTFGLSGALVRLGATAIASGLRIALGWLIALGPIAWIILAVVAIGAALVWAYNKFDWFRDFVDDTWEVISLSAQVAWALIEKTVKDTWDWLKELPGKIVTTFANWMGLPAEDADEAWTSIESVITGIFDWIISIPQQIIDSFKGIWDDFKTATREAFDDILGFIQPAIDKVNDFIGTVKGWFGKDETQLVIGDNGTVNGLTMTPREDLVDTLAPAGPRLSGQPHGTNVLPVDLLATAGDYSEDVAGQLYAGWQQGLYSNEGDLLQAFEDLTDRTIRAVEDGYEIRSPSRVFARIGEMVGTGFIAGLTSTTSSVNQAMANVFDQTTEPTLGSSVTTAVAPAADRGNTLVQIGDINVSTSPGTTADDAEAIAEEVKRTLIEILEDLGLSTGAMP